MIQINGNEAMQADGMSIADYLLSEGYVLSHIAVERNEVIVNKKIMPIHGFRTAMLSKSCSLWAAADKHFHNTAKF